MVNSNNRNPGENRPYWKVGEPLVWGTGVALGIIMLIALILILVIMYNGLGVFWPSNVTLLTLKDETRILGEEKAEQAHPQTGNMRLQLKVGNRDLYNLDFRWVEEDAIAEKSIPPEVIVLERTEYGNFYGYLEEISTPQFEKSPASWEDLGTVIETIRERQEALKPINEEIFKLAGRMENLRNNELELKYQDVSRDSEPYQSLLEDFTRLEKRFEELLVKQQHAHEELVQYQSIFSDASAQTRMIPVVNIVQAYRPNQMSTASKTWFYLKKVGELLTDEPREANTEGGLFPAIFGTVMMVFIMSFLSFPLGVVTAIYLREYAKEGMAVRLVRIAVNNLAGIPSIVYGVFGLGFFVYGVGGLMDRLFFPERLPTPTFGTGGILWASLTLGLLTVPVVIVATEEALGAVPASIREASLALGATKLQTLLRIILPMSSPGIMTGFILAMARAAGEVAPLMITGVVKLAPSLAIDGNFPFVHLERKFMHLGFHIYDVGFQSPNVEAAKPMVFVTTLLLVLVVLVMSSVAIYLRNQMQKRYTIREF